MAIEERPRTPRVEIVTSTFVAAGAPIGAANIERFLENLNNPSVSRHVEIADATVRPLYRAASPLALGAPMFVRRSEIIFATFEGNAIEERPAGSRPESPSLLLAPPFQIQGRTWFAAGADPGQALQSSLAGFFVIRDASVYDAEGYLLGEGEHIVVNGAAVQMATPSSRHIDATIENAGASRRAVRQALTSAESERDRSSTARAA